MEIVIFVSLSIFPSLHYNNYIPTGQLNQSGEEKEGIVKRPNTRQISPDEAIEMEHLLPEQIRKSESSSDLTPKPTSPSIIVDDKGIIHRIIGQPICASRWERLQSVAFLTHALHKTTHR